MENLSTKTVREIAIEMPITTRIFENHKIDYCCGGKRSLEDACRIAGANTATVTSDINRILKNAESLDFEWLRETTLTHLIDYILEKHHVFTKDEVLHLAPLMAKVAGKHGENHPELSKIEHIFGQICSDLQPHMMKEEEILFPYVKNLEKAVLNQSIPSLSCFGSVENPIRVMMNEHDTVGDLLREMRKVSVDYKVPEGACPSYTALFNRLEAFERDLHQHIHLENNLLFPKAVELEEKLYAQ